MSVAGISKGGKVRTLAVTTAERSRTVSEIPTVAESGLPGYNLLGWNGFVAPLGTPAAVVNKVNAVVRQALKQPEVVKQLAAVGQDPGSDFSPEQFRDILKVETAKWTKLVNDTGFKAN